LSDLIKVILLGILEGITEFLPVSSTGHLFLAQNWMGIDLKHGADAAFWKAFGIVIQIGAILAVVIYFRTRIFDLLLGRRALSEPASVTPTGRIRADVPAAAMAGNGSDHSPNSPMPDPPAPGPGVIDYGTASPLQRWRGVIAVALGTLPIYATGLFVGKVSDKLEEYPLAIALALLIGGMIMLLIERLVTRHRTGRLEDISWKQALVVGCCQILAALFPGTSRSAATIMSGLCAGLSRPAATEFSFFLAIPSMFAACGYKMLKWVRDNHPDRHQLVLMGIGTLVSFIVAWIVIAAFMAYIRKHSFVSFAWYRIAFGLLVLGWILLA
jgi:undecaprenyl-diphosphatase